MEAEAFKAFVKEAYIDPIRSVLIVDDDYPTFEEVLSAPNSDKKWHGNPQPIRRVISQFRAEHQPMMVDIHDGTNVEFGAEAKAVSHLHQSDLLVLDYELDRTKKGDGTKAINIVRSILANNHFNLIILHTREELGQVFNEVLLSLLSKAKTIASEIEIAKVNSWIADTENANPDILDQLIASLDISHYLYFRRHNSLSPRPGDQTAPSYAGFDSLCTQSGWTTEEQRSAVAKWVLSKIETAVRSKMNQNQLSELTWSTGEPSWIRSDSGFLAFTNKADNGDEDDNSTNLIEKLLAALCEWKPQPSRLFLAQLRSQIESKGVVAESQVLGTKHVHANWYKRLLESKDAQRDFILSETLSRHTEQLLAAIMPGVTEFASRLVSSEEEGANSVTVCAEHFGVNLDAEEEADRARHEHNAYVCSKPVEGYHLTPGHILRSNESYWICLTPACDLVPNQKTSGRFEDIGENMPFTAVRLQRVVPPEANASSKQRKAFEKTYSRAMNAGRFIVLNVNKALETFSLNRPDDESSAPHWFTLFAANQGKFDQDAKEITFFKAEQAEDGNLTLKPFTAEIVGQLRYEYALNLSHKLGVTMTRIGLDFQ